MQDNVKSAILSGKTSILLPVGSTFTFVGDGLESPSSGVGSGISNTPHQFQQLIAGRLQPTALPILAMSGITIKTNNGSPPWIYPYALDAALAQTPDVFIFDSNGANDNLLSTDPVGSPSVLNDWKTALLYAYNGCVAYGCKLLVVVGTVPSTKTSPGLESTYRGPVWVAQQAYALSLGSGNKPKIIWVDLSGMVPASNFSIDSGSSYTHSDERGGIYHATQLYNAISPYVELRTPNQILDLITAGNYPLMTGVQLDSNTGLTTATSSSLTGPGVTGTIDGSKQIVNTTGATGITVSQVSTVVGRTKTVVDFSGATATSSGGKVMVQDRSNISITTTPGRYVMNGALIRNGAGYWNMGADWNGNLYSLWGGGASSLSSNARVGAGTVSGLDTLMMDNPLSVYSNSTTFTGKRSWAFYWATGSTLTGTFEIERPFSYLISERTKHAATYLGDVRNASNTRLAAATQALRPTGSLSATTGGTIRVEPGLWTPRGMTETDFATRRIYKGTVANLGVGSGTLLATLTGSTWTSTFGAAVAIAGDLIYVEIDAQSGTGPVATARSLTTITVSA